MVQIINDSRSTKLHHRFFFGPKLGEGLHGFGRSADPFCLSRVHRLADEGEVVLAEALNVDADRGEVDYRGNAILAVAEAKQYLEAGHFTEGSMAPKIRAAILFVEATGHEAIITEATKLGDPTCGTRIVK